ncbi:SoxW family protein [Thermus caldifontis]|uniref:SoxW family protein n=1 Tax=Thermus caldifontis TaxID=1930763 RepID=UPI000DF18AEC|nr:thioredoxin family protein [Thermus caldifontis]
MYAYRVLWSLVVLILTAALAAPDFGRWYPYGAALDLAQAHGRIVMVYFHSPHCPYCDQMNTFVLSDPQVSQLLEDRFVVASVGTETPEGQELARRYRVPGTPTFVFLVHRQGTWEEVGRFFGSRPRAQFLQELRQICAKGGVCGE